MRADLYNKACNIARLILMDGLVTALNVGWSWKEGKETVSIVAWLGDLKWGVQITDVHLSGIVSDEYLAARWASELRAAWEARGKR